MTNEKDNKPLLDTSPSRPRDQHGSIVRSLVDGLEGVERNSSRTRRDPGLSLSPLVISSPDTTFQNGTVPPRPPRSPKRLRLADIAEDERGGEREKDTELGFVVADFVRRLEAVPPPAPDLDSPDSTYSTQESIPPNETRIHRRIQSLPVIIEMLEVDRSRSASGGTFGGGLEMGTRAQRGSDETGESNISTIDTLPATPLLPTSGGHSPISPLALTNPPLPGIPNTQDQPARVYTPSPLPPPSLHVTRPSTSSDKPNPDPFTAVINMMDKGDSPGKRRARGESPLPTEVVAEMPPVENPSEGRAQTRRKGMMAPGAILAKVKSSQSLSKIKKQMSKVSLRAPSNITSSTGTNTTFLRPAPLPPPSSTYPARFAHTDYARSNASSPSPSMRFDGSLARASPDPRKSPSRPLAAGVAGDGDEMVEIPRFKRKELNLALVRKRGPWQRIAWVMLWLVWLVNGLAGLFFDVNLMYILVQCTTHSTNGRDGPSRSWAFATAAYAICWGISIFIVWLGWEIYFEFWRKWRQTRPAIEPIYTSLPASLHLSLMSYSHFTFLVHVRLSSMSTPYRYDIIPETAHALVQMLPGILPFLPRAGIGIVLLTTFSSPNASRGDKDERFFSSSGGLNAYAQGVILGFVSVVAFRFLIFLIAAITLWLSSTRPTRAFFSRPANQAQAPMTPKKRSDGHKSSTPPRDPATTRSPQKTWYEAETSFGWDTWRSRMRARLQDAYELCMIRRSGVGIGSMVDGSFLVVGNGVMPSPSFNKAVRLGSRSVRDEGQGSVEELAENAEGGSGKAKALSEDAVDDWLGTPKTGSTLMKMNQKRPENPIPPSDLSHSSPSTNDHATPTLNPKPVPMRTTSNLTVSGVYTAGSQASHSSHDIFYTPTQGNTPMFERTLPILGAGITAQNGLRNMQDPSRGTLPARPESGVMGSSELLSDPNRMSQLSAGSDESITDDSAALLTTSRRGSEATTMTGTGSGTPSRSNSTVSQHQASRRSSASRVVNAVTRSRTGSTASAGQVITRARSSSITLLRESAGAVQGAVRRARSGTVDGNAYNQIDGDTPNTLPRRRSKLGLGPSVIDNRAVSG